ncbi:GDP-mannose 4,6-dehydratase [bacterium]|nr:GDP-mannose 4,6-dehydratase [bacterium]
MSKVAFITGITGQDGAYLAKFLLENGYKVVGGKRRTSTDNYWRLERLGIKDDIELVYFDFYDSTSLANHISNYKPDHFYNLAAQSFVQCSFEQPIYTGQVDYIGVCAILDVIRAVKPDTRFYQASSSEMFGLVQHPVQSEKTPFYPRSPYAVAKLAGHWITVNYRESYNLHASSGILFNHESPLRGEEFVTRKITAGLCRIKKGKQDILSLGNLDAKRDWGYAREYVVAMHMMLNQGTPDDYVIATNKTYTVRSFCEKAAQLLDYNLEWRGSGDNEQGIDTKTGKILINIDPKYYRKAEVELLLGDSTKAKQKLGWEAKTGLDELTKIMIESDLKYV